jgi:wyosine [tRNA(Phe)-imidazoG37] synthetase (radical SAM superfamily)
MQISRRPFYDPKSIFADVVHKVNEVKRLGESIDYLTFVPDGEPTLDIHLGRTIDLLQPLGIKIAVISNGSLLWQKSVRKDLHKTDWVSFKIDAVTKDTWRQINRPHPDLDLSGILQSILRFSKRYEGVLATETMLIRGVNDSLDNISNVAAFLEKLNPFKAYLSIPTRPPAEAWIHSPGEDTLHLAYQVFKEKVRDLFCLFDYEGGGFSSTDNIENDLLDIVAVHPMPEEAVRELLEKAGVDWSLVDKLVAHGLLLATEYRGKVFYLRGVKGSLKGITSKQKR